MRKISKVLAIPLSSGDYISGDNFLLLAQHILLEKKPIITNAIKEGDIFFVRSDILLFFLKEIMPTIPKRIILISHNSDTIIDEQFGSYLDQENIIHCFAQNVNFYHSKLTPLPIGVENKKNFHNFSICRFNFFKNNSSFRRSPKIFYKFNPHTNITIREKAINELTRLETSSTNETWMTLEEHLISLKEHMFVASPEGNGIDCHRTWEALYMDCVPITTTSFLTKYFKNLGLPILLLDDWTDIQLLNNKRTIERIYNDIIHQSDTSPLSQSYWNKKILSYKDEK